jgi:hypothetical protein
MLLLKKIEIPIDRIAVHAHEPLVSLEKILLGAFVSKASKSLRSKHTTRQG